MSAPHSYFCPCPRGLEIALAEELGEIALLGGNTLKIHTQVPGGVHCSGSLQDAYRINLHSRIASRVLMRMAHASYTTENDIYDLTLAQAWEDWFAVHHTIRIDVTAIKSPLRSLEFTTLKIKDAICDRFRDLCNERPSVDTGMPDMRIVGFLDAQQLHALSRYLRRSTVQARLAQETGEAPLRENLAAGLLRTSGWKPGMIAVRSDVRLRHHPGRSGADAGRHSAGRCIAISPLKNSTGLQPAEWRR